MKNPLKAFETGMLLFHQADYDMASIYFENSGDNFLESGDTVSALVAYDKALICFIYLDNQNAVVEIKKKIDSIKQEK